MCLLLVGWLLAAYYLLSSNQDAGDSVVQSSTPSAKPKMQNGDIGTDRVQSEVLVYSTHPTHSESVIVRPDESDEDSGITRNRADKKEEDDTPPWPAGTEDRIYQAIAQNLSKYPITSIISVECEENLCTILLSTPDTKLVGTGAYSGMMEDIRASNLGIGGSSVGVVEYAPGVQVIRLRIDNIQWTKERLRRLREEANNATFKSSKSDQDE